MLELIFNSWKMRFFTDYFGYMSHSCSKILAPIEILILLIFCQFTLMVYMFTSNIFTT